MSTIERERQWIQRMACQTPEERKEDARKLNPYYRFYRINFSTETARMLVDAGMTYGARHPGDTGFLFVQKEAA